MIEKLKYFPAILNEYMEDIIEIAYPDFFSTCDSLEKEALICLKSPEVEVYLNFIQSLKNDAESLYYKEKLILFPRLRIRIENKDIEEQSLSLKRMEEKLALITRSIDSFFERFDFKNNTYLSEKTKHILEIQIDLLHTNWKLLLVKKSRLKEEVSYFRELIVVNNNGKK